MSVWKSHEKLSLLRRNFLLMKSHEIMSGLNTVKQKHSMFQTIFVLSGMHFKSLSMKKRILSSHALVRIKRFTEGKIFTSCAVNLDQNRSASMQNIFPPVNNNEQKLI